MLNTADTINILSEIDAWYFFSLQDLFIDASSALFTATDNRAFFKEVTILVPQSWKNVQGIEVEAATTESLNKVPSADSIMIKWGNTNKKRGQCIGLGEVHMYPKLFDILCISIILYILGSFGTPAFVPYIMNVY